MKLVAAAADDDDCDGERSILPIARLIFTGCWQKNSIMSEKTQAF